jgi:hypothetical protein
MIAARRASAAATRYSAIPDEFANWLMTLYSSAIKSSPLW